MYTVYKIENQINGMCYIGCTSNFKQRKYDHLKRLRKNAQDVGIKKFQKDFNKFGELNFKFIILQNKILDEKEAYKIEETYTLNIPKKLRYNIDIGNKHTDATKRKLGIINGGINNGMYGKKHSNKIKQIISNKSKNRKHSEETKQKLSKINKGKKLSNEHKEKISKSKKGYKHSEKIKMEKIPRYQQFFIGFLRTNYSYYEQVKDLAKKYDVSTSTIRNYHKFFLAKSIY